MAEKPWYKVYRDNGRLCLQVRDTVYPLTDEEACELAAQLRSKAGKHNPLTEVQTYMRDDR